MQDLVGIVRREDEMLRALEAIARLRERAGRVRVAGNRAFNPGWHTALELRNLLTVTEAVARSALERKVRRGPDGAMQIARRPIPELRPDLRQIVEEMK